jgi:hypothetical protein
MFFSSTTWFVFLSLLIHIWNYSLRCVDKKKTYFLFVLDVCTYIFLVAYFGFIPTCTLCFSFLFLYSAFFVFWCFSSLSSVLLCQPRVFRQHTKRFNKKIQQLLKNNSFDFIKNEIIAQISMIWLLIIFKRRQSYRLKFRRRIFHYKMWSMKNWKGILKSVDLAYHLILKIPTYNSSP